MVDQFTNIKFIILGYLDDSIINFVVMTNDKEVSFANVEHLKKSFTCRLFDRSKLVVKRFDLVLYPLYIAFVFGLEMI